MKLGNIRKTANLGGDTKSSYQSFVVLSNFTGYFYFVPIILSGILDHLYLSEPALIFIFLNLLRGSYMILKIKIGLDLDLIIRFFLCRRFTGCCHL